MAKIISMPARIIFMALLAQGPFIFSPYASAADEHLTAKSNISSSPTLADLNKSLKTRPHRPLELKRRALLLLQSGQTKPALVDLEEYTTSCPNSWMAFACRATAKAASSDDLGAVQDIARYLYIKRNVSFHVGYSAQRADIEDKSHPGPIPPPELSISTSECNQLRASFAKQLGKATPANDQAQAVLSFFEHDYRTALKTLSRTKAEGRQLAVLLGFRSIFHRAVGAFDLATKEALQAITLAPDQRVFYDTLDGAYYAADKREDGLKALIQMAAVHPSNTSLLLAIADVHSQLGDRDKARDILSSILKTSPKSIDARLMRADIYKADLLNDKAYDDYKVVNETSPGNGKAIEGMGFCCYELNQVDKALKFFQDANVLCYDLRRVYAAQALCLEKQGKRAMANKLKAESANFSY